MTLDRLILRKIPGPPTLVSLTLDKEDRYWDMIDMMNTSNLMMLTEMIHELNRLIIKYSSTEWSSMKIAQFLVELLNEHLTLIKDELTEALSGERKLQNDDSLGPETRKAMLTSEKEKDLTEDDVVSAA